MSWTKQDTKTLADRILSFSKAKECEVALSETSLVHTRFAANEITTSGAARDLSISITSRGEGKSGSVRVNDLDPEALRKAVALSEELMRAATPDPESVDGLGPQTYPEIRSFHEDTARAGARRAPPRREGRSRRGARAKADRVRLLGNDRDDLRDREQERQLRLPRGEYGDVFDDDAHGGRHGLRVGRIRVPRFGDVKAADLAARAAKKAQASASPKELPPGAYTVILEPRAVADLLGTSSSSRSPAVTSTRGGASCPSRAAGTGSASRSSRRSSRCGRTPSTRGSRDARGSRGAAADSSGSAASGAAAPRDFRRGRRRGSRRESSRTSPSTVTGPRSRSSKRFPTRAVRSWRAGRAPSKSSSPERSAAFS